MIFKLKICNRGNSYKWRAELKTIQQLTDSLFTWRIENRGWKRLFNEKSFETFCLLLNASICLILIRLFAYICNLSLSFLMKNFTIFVNISGHFLLFFFFLFWLSEYVIYYNSNNMKLGEFFICLLIAIIQMTYR